MTVCQESFDCQCGNRWSKCSILRFNIEIGDLQNQVDYLKNVIGLYRKSLIRVMDEAADTLKVNYK